MSETRTFVGPEEELEQRIEGLEEESDQDIEKSEKEPDSYIESPELAHVMANAENRYRMLEIAARALGFPEEAELNSYFANEAGVEAARQYLSNLVYQVESGVGIEDMDAHEQEFKEKLMAGLPAAYGVYVEMLTLLNQQRKGNLKVRMADYDYLCGLAEDALIPEVVRELMAEVQQVEVDAYASENKRKALAPGFDLLIVPNRVELTHKEVKALASSIQSNIHGWRGGDYLRIDPIIQPNLDRVGLAGVSVLAIPRHSNLPNGSFDDHQKYIDSANEDRYTALRRLDLFGALMSVMHAVKVNPSRVDWSSKYKWSDERDDATRCIAGPGPDEYNKICDIRVTSSGMVAIGEISATKLQESRVSVALRPEDFLD